MEELSQPSSPSPSSIAAFSLPPLAHFLTRATSIRFCKPNPSAQTSPSVMSDSVSSQTSGSAAVLSDGRSKELEFVSGNALSVDFPCSFLREALDAEFVFEDFGHSLSRSLSDPVGGRKPRTQELGKYGKMGFSPPLVVARRDEYMDTNLSFFDQIACSMKKTSLISELQRSVQSLIGVQDSRAFSNYKQTDSSALICTKGLKNRRKEEVCANNWLGRGDGKMQTPLELLYHSQLVSALSKVLRDKCILSKKELKKFCIHESGIRGKRYAQGGVPFVMASLSLSHQQEIKEAQIDTVSSLNSNSPTSTLPSMEESDLKSSLANPNLDSATPIRDHSPERAHSSENVSHMAKQAASKVPGSFSVFEKAAMGAAAGGFAGAFTYACLHPLDTVKTKLQTRGASEIYSGSLDVVIKVLKKEGILGFYPGISAVLVGSTISSAIYFGTCEFGKSFLSKIPSVPPLVIPPLAGAMGNIVSSSILVPKEVVTQKMQAGAAGRSWQVLTKIVQTEGLGGLYVGYSAALLRNLPTSVLSFSTFEYLKGAFLARSKKGSLEPWQSVTSGAIAGAVAATLTTPLDVVKTRLMTQSTASIPLGALKNQVSTLTYKGVASTLKQIWIEEGWIGLTRGVGPRLLHSACFSAIGFFAFETARLAIVKQQMQTRALKDLKNNQSSAAALS